MAAIEAYASRMERERKSGVGNAFALATDANIFVEGIALVRLARVRGIRTRSQYPLIPPIVLKEAPPGGIQRRPIWKG
jgi:hypothetical protein